jgi:hypothetical protein
MTDPIDPGIISFGPGSENQSVEMLSPTVTAWFKIAPGVFAEYAFDRHEFGAATPNRTLVGGVATGQVQVNLADAERVD